MSKKHLNSIEDLEKKLADYEYQLQRAQEEIESLREQLSEAEAYHPLSDLPY